MDNVSDTTVQQPQEHQEEKLEWVTPVVTEAEIEAITESVGLGNNDGAASHT